MVNVDDDLDAAMMDGLFREPEGGTRHWISAGVGALAVVFGLLGRFDGLDAYLYLFFGLFIGLTGGAELLPRDRRRAAGVVRIAALACLLVVGVLALTQIFRVLR